MSEGTGTGTYTGSSGSGTGTSTVKTFLEQTQDDLAIFFDVTRGFAQNAAYTPAGGSASVIPVIFTREELPELGMESAHIYCEAKTTDVIAAKPGEAITIGGVAYKILNPPRHSANGTSEIDLSVD